MIQKIQANQLHQVISWFLFSYSLFTFFCLDAKESNKEKIKKEKIYSNFLSFALIEL